MRKWLLHGSCKIFTFFFNMAKLAGEPCAKNPIFQPSAIHGVSGPLFFSAKRAPATGLWPIATLGARLWGAAAMIDLPVYGVFFFKHSGGK